MKKNKQEIICNQLVYRKITLIISSSMKINNINYNVLNDLFSLFKLGWVSSALSVLCTRV